MGWSAHGLDRLLFRIRTLASQGRVRMTAKALDELWGLELGLDADDAVDLLRALVPREYSGRVRSHRTGEWLYVFRPAVARTELYLKLLVRSDCVIVSFHEDHDDEPSD